jgi:hypothetical protein
MATAEQIQAKLNSIPIDKKNALITRAKQVNAAHRQRVQQFVDTNQKLLKADPGTVYLGGGEITMGVLIAYGLLSVTSAFVGNPSGVLTFEGHDWSYGLGAWEGYGAAVFTLPPNQLTGAGSITVVAGGLEENAFTLMVYDRNGLLYGNITGIAEGGGLAGGNISGSFSWSGS